MATPERSTIERESVKIDNPLARLNKGRLFESADAFARRVDPNNPDIRLWRNAAEVARHLEVPNLCNRISGLTDKEKKAIETQREAGFWQQPKQLQVTIVTLCLAAIIQGWVQTGLNGANLTWAKQFGLTDHNGPPTDTRGAWIFSAINAALYLSASILGCWLSDPLQSLVFGRRGAIFFSAWSCLAGAIGCAFSRTWPQLLGCRIVLGAAMGAKASVTPIYGAEVSPTHLRGTLVMNWQLFDAFGIFLGFAANLIVSKSGDDCWRYEVASAVIPTMCLLSLVWTIPESGRWYLKKGRYPEAFKSFCAVRETPLQAAAEMFYANAQLQAELELLGRIKQSDIENQNKDTQGRGRQRFNHVREAIDRVDAERLHNRATNPARPITVNRNGCLTPLGHIKNLWYDITHDQPDVDLDGYQQCAKSSYYVQRITQLFSIPRIRRATTAALIMMIAQQLCGINILQFYSTTFFHDPHLESDSLLGPALSLGFGFANFIFTFPIYMFIDTRGRRFLLLSSYPGMIFSMLGGCLSYKIDDDNRRLAAIIVFMFLFVFFYAWGQGPVPFAYSSEVFPQINREAGMSFVVFVNLFGAGILALVVPQLIIALTPHPDDPAQLKIGESNLLGIFTGLNVVALILIFFFVPETFVATRNADGAHGLMYISLEEMNYIFNERTSKHIEYQTRYIVPWAWKMLKWKWNHYVLRRGGKKPENPKPLFIWQQAEELSEMNEQGEGKSESNNRDDSRGRGM